MQRIAAPCFSNELSLVHRGIAALCYEKMRVQTQQQEFRHCERDQRHDAWDVELKTIEEKKRDLVEKQKIIIKQSQKCSVGVDAMCI